MKWKQGLIEMLEIYRETNKISYNLMKQMEHLTEKNKKQALLTTNRNLPVHNKKKLCFIPNKQVQIQ